MSNIWVTSDTHFSHKNIVRGVSNWFDKPPKREIDFKSNAVYSQYCLQQQKQIEATRDFPTVEDHDNYIIDQINKKVKPTDTLWHLGDFGFGFNLKEKLPELRARIACKDIRLVFGNHDHVIEKAAGLVFPDDTFKRIKECFTWTGYLKFGKVSGRACVFCHYAMKTWPWQHHGSIHAYGHSHGNLADDPNSLSLDVGIDTCLYGHTKYTPYSIDELFHIMDTHKRFVAVDHHGEGTN